MIAFSSSAKKARAVFFNYRNSIDIFTEDETGDKEFYSVVFKRLFENSTIRIKDVFPIGSRTEVVAAYERWKANRRRPAYFLVDADIDLALGTLPPTEKNFSPLRKYCIENYVVCEEACIDFAYYSDPRRAKTAHARALAVRRFLESESKPLVQLFHHLAISRMYNLGFKHHTAFHYLSKDCTVDRKKIAAFNDSVRTKLIQKGLAEGFGGSEKYKKSLRSLEANWSIGWSSASHIVSGKDFLLPLLYKHIGKNVNSARPIFPLQSVKVFFAERCDIEELAYVREAIERCI